MKQDTKQNAFKMKFSLKLKKKKVEMLIFFFLAPTWSVTNLIRRLEDVFVFVFF